MATTTTTNSYIRVLTVLVAMVAAALLVAMMMAYGSASAQSTTNTIKVTTKDDEGTPNDGKCSLREAILNTNDITQPSPDCQAGSDTEEDRIIFALGNKATIVLGSQLPTITDPSGLTIDGQKAKITVSGQKQVRVFKVNPGAKLTLERLTVADGSTGDFFGGGGGVHNEGGTLEVSNSTFSGNSAEAGLGSQIFGGGIFNSTGGTLKVSNSTFSGNSASGDSGLDFGGGISNFKGSSAEVSNSTFSGNSADVGGGISNNQGRLEVSNSTFSGNSAQGDFGGGFHTNGETTLSNSIMANSPSGGSCGIFGPLTDGGYNISSDASCAFSQPTSKNSTNPQLASSLANNGGPTQTIKLLKGSPALNAIPEATNGCGTEITTDQRGVKRPQGKGCDIGAYELKLKSSGNHHHHRHHHKHKGGGGGGGGIGIGG